MYELQGEKKGKIYIELYSMKYIRLSFYPKMLQPTRFATAVNFVKRINMKRN